MDIKTLRENLTAEILRLRVAHEALSGMKNRGIKNLRNELDVEIKRLTSALTALDQPSVFAQGLKPRRSARKATAAA